MTYKTIEENMKEEYVRMFGSAIYDELSQRIGVTSKSYMSNGSPFYSLSPKNMYFNKSSNEPDTKGLYLNQSKPEKYNMPVTQGYNSLTGSNNSSGLYKNHSDKVNYGSKSSSGMNRNISLSAGGRAPTSFSMSLGSSKGSK